ncbi:hypothetical protein PR202_ga19795 [Eleusine coracana subsp. coracana]|uniref:Uncharacterized protein n=1 Tax=Eleusine coracana subsp. coracana TaxID=191504 RepID=A0AAV5CV62_ELECO|nr:hypothetical protein PR202_ga19795 [Eleusine coracana subsp. coracana]
MLIILLLQKKLLQAVEWPIKHSAAFARLGFHQSGVCSCMVHQGVDYPCKSYSSCCSSFFLFFELTPGLPCKTGPGGSANGNVMVGERLLSTMLTEMDGLELAMRHASAFPVEVGGVKAHWEIPNVCPLQKLFLQEINGRGNISSEEFIP